MRKGNHHHRVTRLPYTSSEKKQKQHPPPSSRTAHLHVIIPSCCTASKSIVFLGLFVLASRHTIVATLVALRAVSVKDKDTSSSFRREAAAAREDLLSAKYLSYHQSSLWPLCVPTGAAGHYHNHRHRRIIIALKR